jgi:hypothetical protein
MALDAAVADRCLYVTGCGRLHVAYVSDPAAPTVLAA